MKKKNFNWFTFFRSLSLITKKFKAFSALKLSKKKKTVKKRLFSVKEMSAQK